MKANELRIGNIVYPEAQDIPGTVLSVHGPSGSAISSWCGHNVHSQASKYRPVPLTKEILLEWFGRNSLGFIGLYYVDIENDGLCHVCNPNGLIRFLHYVHELQNLVFAIEGEELPVKLPTQ